MPVPGWNECASEFPGPSNGMPSPCEAAAKLISMSEKEVVSSNVRADTSLHIYIRHRWQPATLCLVQDHAKNCECNETEWMKLCNEWNCVTKSGTVHQTQSITLSILNGFSQVFAGRICGKFAIKLSFKIPPYQKNVSLHYLVKQKSIKFGVPFLGHSIDKLVTSQ